MIHPKYSKHLIALLITSLLVSIIAFPAAADGTKPGTLSDISVTSEVYAGPYFTSYEDGNRVTDYFPDADSYTVSRMTGYQFKFTVMQPIDTDTAITITFPVEMQLPDAIDTQHIRINSVQAASAEFSGSQLIVLPPVPLDSGQSVIITIAPEAQIANPAEPGYYEFLIQSATDMSAAARTISFIPEEGSSLNSEGGNLIREQDGSLYFISPVHTIHKAGDTVTVTGPEGTILTNPDISLDDIVIELWGMSEEIPLLSPSSIERLSDSMLRFTLPEGFYLDPGDVLSFRLPAPLGQTYGIYTFEVFTSVETIPALFSLEIGPERIESFSVIPSSRIPGAEPIAYTFKFISNQTLRAEDYHIITLQLPDEMELPYGIDPSTITVNGVPVEQAYENPDQHAIQVFVPTDIPLLSEVTVQFHEQAGLSNPTDEGLYRFAVWAGYLEPFMATITEVEYGIHLPDPDPTQEWVELYFEQENLYFDLAQKQQLVLHGVKRDGSVHLIELSEVMFTASTPQVANISTGGTITAAMPGTTVITAAYGNLRAELSVYVSPYLNDEVLLEIDTQHDGLHMDDVVRYLRNADSFDLNGDGLSDHDDAKLLLYTLDRIYYSPLQ